MGVDGEIIICHDTRVPVERFDPETTTVGVVIPIPTPSSLPSTGIPDDEPEFTRLSLCCHAAVVHITPITSRSLKVALEMICACCHGRIVAFDVVNEVGEVVWRVE